MDKTPGRLDIGSLADKDILVVDDDEHICMFIKLQLEADNIGQVRMAYDGLQGLAEIEKKVPDLVILDIQMPNLDGIETLKRIRAQPTLVDLPVIVETALFEMDQRAEILAAGATNIISKPLNFDLLKSRVRMHLERQDMVNSLIAYQSRIREELELAKVMQDQLLPRSADQSRALSEYGCTTDWVFETSSELGGDFFALRFIDEHRLGLLIADFMGHGVYAAINTFRLHLMMNEQAYAHNSPAELLEQLNEGLNRVLEGVQFATLLYAVIDMEADTLTYAAAAAPNPIVGDRASGVCHVGDGSGVPLGAQKGTTYENHRIDFPPGSFLFLHSDALSEGLKADGSLIDDAGVREMVDVAVTVSQTVETDSPLAALKARFFETNPPPLGDDLTMIWLERAK